MEYKYDQRTEDIGLGIGIGMEIAGVMLLILGV